MVSWVAQQDEEWQLLKGREGKKDLGSLWLIVFQSFLTPSTETTTLLWLIVIEIAKFLLKFTSFAV